ncbi:hypothetical protein ACJX0J_017847 [Zea mays]
MYATIFMSYFLFLAPSSFTLRHMQDIRKIVTHSSTLSLNLNKCCSIYLNYMFYKGCPLMNELYILDLDDKHRLRTVYLNPTFISHIILLHKDSICDERTSDLLGLRDGFQYFIIFTDDFNFKMRYVENIIEFTLYMFS